MANNLFFWILLFLNIHVYYTGHSSYETKIENHTGSEAYNCNKYSKPTDVIKPCDKNRAKIVPGYVEPGFTEYRYGWNNVTNKIDAIILPPIRVNFVYKMTTNNINYPCVLQFTRIIFCDEIILIKFFFCFVVSLQDHTNEYALKDKYFPRTFLKFSGRNTYHFLHECLNKYDHEFFKDWDLSLNPNQLDTDLFKSYYACVIFFYSVTNSCSTYPECIDKLSVFYGDLVDKFYIKKFIDDFDILAYWELDLNVFQEIKLSKK